MGVKKPEEPAHKLFNPVPCGYKPVSKSSKPIQALSSSKPFQVNPRTMQQQYIDTLTNWLVELKNDTVTLNSIDRADIALMHKANDAIRIMNNVTLKDYTRGASYLTWLELSSEMENLAYQLRVSYHRTLFDSKVSTIRNYLRELQSKSLPDYVAENHFNSAKYDYNDAKKYVNLAKSESLRSNAEAQIFFNKMHHIEPEMICRLNTNRELDFPPLSASLKR